MQPETAPYQHPESQRKHHVKPSIAKPAPGSRAGKADVGLLFAPLNLRSYAPVTLLIDQRADGVHLSYDAMASLLAQYENAEALHVARDLDELLRELLLSESEGAAYSLRAPESLLAR